MSRKLWNEAETENLVIDYLSGMSYKDMKDKYNCAYWQVTGKINTLKQAGVKLPPRPRNANRVNVNKLNSLIATKGTNQ